MMYKIKTRAWALLAFGLLFLGLAQKSQGQSTTITLDDQGKYWYMRYQLRNDLMVMGLDWGESLPATVRNANGNALRWADANISLGWYLAVLGTENELLTQTNDLHGLKINEIELYYALKAMERIDKYAETHPNNGQAGIPMLNGYFARDDVRANFVTQNSTALNSSSTHAHPVNLTESDWMLNNTNHEMSRDQMVQLLMGLKMVWFYANYSTNVTLLDGSVVTYNPGELAKNSAIHILNYALNSSLGMLRNPITGQRVARGGYWVLDLEWPMKQLRWELLGHPILQTPIFNAPANYIAWRSVFTLANDPINRHMVAVMGATCKNSISRSTLGVKADAEDWKPFYHLIYDVFNGEPKGGHWDALAQLHDAPCQGISHNAASIGVINNSNGWHATQRYIKSKGDQQNGVHSGTLWGVFNGLDYMLLHNLYYLKSNNSKPIYKNRFERFVIGPVSGTKQYGGFDNVQSNATIQGGSNVEYRGGQFVELEPGFETLPSAEFLAYTGIYSCQFGAYQKNEGETDMYGFSTNVPEHPEQSVETSGSTIESDLLVESDRAISVYPNPSKGLFAVELGHLHPEVTLQVFSLDGKAVKTVRARNQRLIEVDLSGTPPGVYLLQVTSSDALYTERIVLQ